MINPIDARNYINDLIIRALTSPEVITLFSPLPLPLIYWQGLNVTDLVDGVISVHVYHKSLKKNPSFIGERIIYEDRAVFLEMKSPLSLEGGFDKIEELTFLLEGALSVNIKNENSAVRLKSPQTEYSDYREGYNSIVLSVGYSFETDLNDRNLS
jgi:hypothetical protein